MYISTEQTTLLDAIVKNSEVAVRSFVAETLHTAYPDEASFRQSLSSISISEEPIYSKRFNAKLKDLLHKKNETFKIIESCTHSIRSKKYNNDVPYVSDLIDLLLIYFNAHFAEKEISRNFISIEEFHYCCTLYHRIRNNLSHPASRPTTEIDASKTIYFIENILASLNEKYFWYQSKNKILDAIKNYKRSSFSKEKTTHNLAYATSTHKTLLCREAIIETLYESILGNNTRRRLAGSVILYGYGGVGKTAITTEFLYRILRDQQDGNYLDIEYILFFSSKDEYLRENKTTAELYIDTAKPEFSSLQDLQSLLCTALSLSSIDELMQRKDRGIITIDNIENLPHKEKLKILDFIKNLPRTIQFIVTSRNEEACEEKIHVEEFKDDYTGISFVEEMVESEGFNIDIKGIRAQKILKASKGNALIIVQVLSILNRGTSTFEEITSSLESMRSKNSEMIANFMYKNTFDNALISLSEKGKPAKGVMQIISLYDEKIELYSISKLGKTNISDAEEICNYLLERLILKKTGEYYELNEFARRFVFIKLLPDKFELSNLKDKIKQHKERMKQKLAVLEKTLGTNSRLHQNVTEWQPRNYVDKIIIAELFSLYGDAIKCIRRNDKETYEKHLKEFEEHSFITKHPYIPLQKARLLREGISRFYVGNQKITTQVEHLYEEAIEAIEYDYRYLVGSIAHASLLMFFGVFLCSQHKQQGRSIRFLEEAKLYMGENRTSGWFITCNYLSIAYESRYLETNDQAYQVQLKKLVKEVIENFPKSRGVKFRFDSYCKQFKKWIK